MTRKQYTPYTDGELARLLGLDEPGERPEMIRQLNADDVEDFAVALSAAIDSQIDIPGAHAVTTMYRAALAHITELEAKLSTESERKEMTMTTDADELEDFYEALDAIAESGLAVGSLTAAADMYRAALARAELAEAYVADLGARLDAAEAHVTGPCPCAVASRTA